MLRTVAIGQYVVGNSLLHRLDPRSKILAVLFLMVTLFVAKGWLAYLVLAGLVVLAYLLAGISPRYMWRALRPVLFILFFTVTINLLWTRGEVVWRFWRLAVTREGLHMAATMSTRLILLVTSAALLTLTTSPIALTDGLEHLLAPGKRIGIPSHELALMLTIALRFIPTLVDEADKIMKAQMARGADFAHGGLVQRARSLLPLLVPLFVSSFRRADELATAMEARCYRGGEGRTRLRELRYSVLDAAAGVVLAAVCGSVLWMRFGGPRG
ncbi:MAG: energy-coupling factor transporter transmembrane component T [Bacillota bacterium]|nr:energy-coupling factor transporter transmembrane component T [Bacillota bacterium]